jgi:hypothetical protein
LLNFRIAAFAAGEALMLARPGEQGKRLEQEPAVEGPVALQVAAATAPFGGGMQFLRDDQILCPCGRELSATQPNAGRIESASAELGRHSQITWRACGRIAP